MVMGQNLGCQAAARFPKLGSGVGRPVEAAVRRTGFRTPARLGAWARVQFCGTSTTQAARCADEAHRVLTLFDPIA